MRLTELEAEELDLLIGQMKYMGENYASMCCDTKYLAEYMIKFADRLRKIVGGEYDIAYNKPDLKGERQ